MEIPDPAAVVASSSTTTASSSSSSFPPNDNDQDQSSSPSREHSENEDEFGEPVSWTFMSSSLNGNPADEEEDDEEERQPKTYEFHIVSNGATTEEGIDEEDEEEEDGNRNNDTLTHTGRGESTSEAVTGKHSSIHHQSTGSSPSMNRAEPPVPPTNSNSNDDEEEEEDNEEGYSIPMHQVEQLVAMRLRQLDRDYDASLSVDISQPLPSSSATTSTSVASTATVVPSSVSSGIPSTIRNPRIAASLANRPDLAAKMEALHRMAASMAMGTSALPMPNLPVSSVSSSSSSSSSSSTKPSLSSSSTIPTGSLSWETFDDSEFPDDYGELQSKDSQALRDAKEKEEKERLHQESIQYAKDLQQAEGFHPFPHTPNKDGQVTALKVRKSSSLTFIGESSRTMKPKSTAASSSSVTETVLPDVGTIADQVTKANAQLQAKKLSSKLPPVRAVSPLAKETRSAIQESMSRIHITPKGGPPSVWLEQTIQQALQRGKLSIETYQQQQKK